MLRRSSAAILRPVIQLYHIAGPSFPDNSKLRRKSHEKFQQFIVFACGFFIVCSSIISLFGSERVGDLIAKNLIKNGRLLSSSTSAPPLSYAQRQDMTWPDNKCRSEFPLLYPQLEESFHYWKKRGGITKQLIDQNEKSHAEHWGHARVLIRNRKAYLRSFREGTDTRNSALVHLIALAVDTWPTSSFIGRDRHADLIPPIDMFVTPGDRETNITEAAWAVTRPTDGSEPGNWLLPDFGFISWPEAGAGYYEDIVEQIETVEEDYPWYKKADKLFWRGFPNWYRVRIDLMQRVSPIVDPSRSEWADIRRTEFHNNNYSTGISPLVSLPDHCKHKFLVHTEGFSYSGRSKYIFNCHSVTVVHPLEWTQYFHPALNGDPHSPNQNYVQLQGPDFKDLEVAAKELRKADGGYSSPKARNYIGHKAPETIADNAVRTLRNRYLSPAATMCYVRAALRHYANSLDQSSWGSEGITLLPGDGVAPDSSKNAPKGHLKGDVQVGVWRLLGAPDWPPANDTLNTTNSSILCNTNITATNATNSTNATNATNTIIATKATSQAKITATSSTLIHS